MSYLSHQNTNNYKQLNKFVKCQQSKEFKKSSLISVKIHHPTVQLDQLMRKINTIGKLPSWDPMTHLTQVVSSSWMSTSQLTTHSSHQRSTSPPGSIIQTSTPTDQSALISSRSNGPQLLPSPRFSSHSAHCCVMPTLMIPWCQRLPRSTRLTKQSTRLLPENGLESMPCEYYTPDILYHDEFQYNVKVYDFTRNNL